jgi:hypothetical protein
MRQHQAPADLIPKECTEAIILAIPMFDFLPWKLNLQVLVLPDGSKVREQSASKRLIFVERFRQNQKLQRWLRFKICFIIGVTNSVPVSCSVPLFNSNLTNNAFSYMDGEDNTRFCAGPLAASRIWSRRSDDLHVSCSVSLFKNSNLNMMPLVT